MKWKKLISIFTTACFLVSFVFGDVLHASIDTSGKAERVKEAMEKAVIGQGIGRITDAWVPGDLSSKAGAGSLESRNRGLVVVNIQDLHCHAEVQRNIEKILGQLDKKYGLKKVYVEGAYGDVDTSWLCNIKQEKFRNRITEDLVNEGKLTGTEYYSVRSNRPELLKGIEDRKVHEDNIVRLGKMLEKKEYFESKIKGFEKELLVMEAKYFSSKNKRFNRIIEKYKAGKMPPEKFYKLLNKYAQKINENPGEYNSIFSINPNSYPNVNRYIKLMDTGKKLDYPKISRELGGLVQYMKTKVPYNVFNAMVDKTDNFKKLDELYACLAEISREYGLDVAGNYPDLKKFFDYTENSRNINPLQLIDEEKRLIGEIRVGFSNDISELEVSFLKDFFGYFRDYMLNRITADDYGYFQERFAKFRDIWSKYAFRDGIEELSGDFSLLNDFYAANCKRNDCFIKNIPELARSVERAADRNDKNKDTETNYTPNADPDKLNELLKDSEIVVVVTGGFHTEGLRKLLSAKGIAHLTITPNISQSTKNSNLVYAEFAKQQAKILSNSLALAIASQLKTPALVNLMIAAAKSQLSGKNMTEEQFDTLVEAIKEAIGDNNIDSSYETGTIKLSNGRTVNITKEGTGGTVKEITLAGEMKAQAAVSADVAIKVLESLLSGTLGAAKFSVLCPDVYSILKNLFVFAEENNYVNGYGLIWGISEILKSDTGLRSEIEGIAVEKVANLPAGAQQMILERVNAIDALKAQPDVVKKAIRLALLELTGLTQQAKKPEELTPPASKLNQSSITAEACAAKVFNILLKDNKHFSTALDKTAKYLAKEGYTPHTERKVAEQIRGYKKYFFLDIERFKADKSRLSGIIADILKTERFLYSYIEVAKRSNSDIVSLKDIVNNLKGLLTESEVLAVVKKLEESGNIKLGGEGATVEVNFDKFAKDISETNGAKYTAPAREVFLTDMASVMVEDSVKAEIRQQAVDFNRQLAPLLEDLKSQLLEFQNGINELKKGVSDEKKQRVTEIRSEIQLLVEENSDVISKAKSTSLTEFWMVSEYRNAFSQINLLAEQSIEEIDSNKFQKAENILSKTKAGIEKASQMLQRIAVLANTDTPIPFTIDLESGLLYVAFNEIPLPSKQQETLPDTKSLTGKEKAGTEVANLSSEERESNVLKWITAETNAKGVEYLSIPDFQSEYNMISSLGKMTNAINAGKIVVFKTPRENISEPDPADFEKSGDYYFKLMKSVETISKNIDHYYRGKFGFGPRPAMVETGVDAGMLVSGPREMADLEYYVRSMVKNAFTHGNGLNLGTPIYMYVDAGNREVRVYNVSDKKLTEEIVNDKRWEFAKSSGLTGQGRGVKIMKGIDDDVLHPLGRDENVDIIYQDGNDGDFGLKTVSASPSLKLFEARAVFTPKNTGRHLSLGNIITGVLAGILIPSLLMAQQNITPEQLSIAKKVIGYVVYAMIGFWILEAVVLSLEPVGSFIYKMYRMVIDKNTLRNMEKLALSPKDREKAIPYYIKQLENSNNDVTAKAAELLAKIGDKEQTISILTKNVRYLSLLDDTAQNAAKAVELLVRLGDKERTIPVLTKNTTNFGIKLKGLKSLEASDEILFDYCAAGLKLYNKENIGIIMCLGELYSQRDRAIPLLLEDVFDFSPRAESLLKLGAAKDYRGRLLGFYQRGLSAWNSNAIGYIFDLKDPKGIDILLQNTRNFFEETKKALVNHGATPEQFLKWYENILKSNILASDKKGLVEGYLAELGDIAGPLSEKYKIYFEKKLKEEKRLKEVNSYKPYRNNVPSDDDPQGPRPSNPFSPGLRGFDPNIALLGIGLAYAIAGPAGKFAAELAIFAAAALAGWIFLFKRPVGKTRSTGAVIPVQPEAGKAGPAEELTVEQIFARYIIDVIDSKALTTSSLDSEYWLDNILTGTEISNEPYVLQLRKNPILLETFLELFNSLNDSVLDRYNYGINTGYPYWGAILAEIFNIKGGASAVPENPVQALFFYLIDVLDQNAPITGSLDAKVWKTQVLEDGRIATKGYSRALRKDGQLLGDTIKLYDNLNNSLLPRFPKSVNAGYPYFSAMLALIARQLMASSGPAGSKGSITTGTGNVAGRPALTLDNTYGFYVWLKEKGADKFNTGHSVLDTYKSFKERFFSYDRNYRATAWQDLNFYQKGWYDLSDVQKKWYVEQAANLKLEEKNDARLNVAPLFELAMAKGAVRSKESGLVDKLTDTPYLQDHLATVRSIDKNEVQAWLGKGMQAMLDISVYITGAVSAGKKNQSMSAIEKILKDIFKEELNGNIAPSSFNGSLKILLGYTDRIIQLQLGVEEAKYLANVAVHSWFNYMSIGLNKPTLTVPAGVSPMLLSERVRNIRPSPTLALDAKVKALQAKGVDVISFGIGEPDFETPVNVREAGKRAIDAGFTKYAPVSGTPELKQAIINELMTEDGLEYKPEEIIVSNGAKHSLYNVFQAVLNPGDELIVLSPYWVSYPDMAYLAEAKVNIVEARESNGFKVTPEQLEKAITEKTKALVINSPSNPTGSAYTAEELKAIGEICVKHNILIISDEIYEKLTYDGFKAASIASMSPEIKARTLVISGVSKSYAMTGWRIGYTAGPKEIIGAMTNLQSQSTSNPSSISMKAAVEAIRGPQESIEKMRQEFEQRRDYILQRFDSIEGVKCFKPQGAFYVFPNVKGLLKILNLNSSSELAELLLEKAKIAVVPGEAFGAPGYIRLSYATSRENIKTGMDRFEAAVNELKTGTAKTPAHAMIALGDNQAFAMIKSDGLAMEKAIIDELARRGFIVKARVEKKIDRAAAEEFYKEHKGKPFYNGLVDYITNGNVVVLVLESNQPNAQERLKAEISVSDGSTPGSVRAMLGVFDDYKVGKDGVRYKTTMNKIHCSGASDASTPYGVQTAKWNAERELSVVLTPEEQMGVSKQSISKGSNLSRQNRIGTAIAAGIITVAAIALMFPMSGSESLVARLFMLITGIIMFIMGLPTFSAAFEHLRYVRQAGLERGGPISEEEQARINSYIEQWQSTHPGITVTINKNLDKSAHFQKYDKTTGKLINEIQINPNRLEFPNGDIETTLEMVFAHESNHKTVSMPGWLWPVEEYLATWLDGAGMVAKSIQERNNAISKDERTFYDEEIQTMMVAGPVAIVIGIFLSGVWSTIFIILGAMTLIVSLEQKYGRKLLTLPEATAPGLNEVSVPGQHVARNSEKKESVVEPSLTAENDIPLSEITTQLKSLKAPEELEKLLWALSFYLRGPVKRENLKAFTKNLEGIIGEKDAVELFNTIQARRSTPYSVNGDRLFGNYFYINDDISRPTCLFRRDSGNLIEAIQNGYFKAKNGDNHYAYFGNQLEDCEIDFDYPICSGNDYVVIMPAGKFNELRDTEGSMHAFNAHAGNYFGIKDSLNISKETTPIIFISKKLQAQMDSITDAGLLSKIAKLKKTVKFIVVDPEQSHQQIKAALKENNLSALGSNICPSDTAVIFNVLKNHFQNIKGGVAGKSINKGGIIAGVLAGILIPSLLMAQVREQRISEQLDTLYTVLAYLGVVSVVIYALKKVFDKSIKMRWMYTFGDREKAKAYCVSQLESSSWAVFKNAARFLVKMGEKERVINKCISMLENNKNIEGLADMLVELGEKDRAIALILKGNNFYAERITALVEIGANYDDISSFYYKSLASLELERKNANDKMYAIQHEVPDDEVYSHMDLNNPNDAELYSDLLFKFMYKIPEQLGALKEAYMQAKTTLGLGQETKKTLTLDDTYGFYYWLKDLGKDADGRPFLEAYKELYDKMFNIDAAARAKALSDKKRYEEKWFKLGNLDRQLYKNLAAGLIKTVEGLSTTDKEDASLNVAPLFEKDRAEAAISGMRMGVDLKTTLYFRDHVENVRRMELQETKAWLGLGLEVMLMVSCLVAENVSKKGGKDILGLVKVSLESKFNQTLRPYAQPSGQVMVRNILKAVEGILVLNLGVEEARRLAIITTHKFFNAMSLDVNKPTLTVSDADSNSVWDFVGRDYLIIHFGLAKDPVALAAADKEALSKEAQKMYEELGKTGKGQKEQEKIRREAAIRYAPFAEMGDIDKAMKSNKALKAFIDSHRMERESEGAWRSRRKELARGVDFIKESVKAVNNNFSSVKEASQIAVFVANRIIKEMRAGKSGEVSFDELISELGAIALLSIRSPLAGVSVENVGDLANILAHAAWNIVHGPEGWLTAHAAVDEKEIKEIETLAADAQDAYLAYMTKLAEMQPRFFTLENEKKKKGADKGAIEEEIASIKKVTEQYLDKYNAKRAALEEKYRSTGRDTSALNFVEDPNCDVWMAVDALFGDYDGIKNLATNIIDTKARYRKGITRDELMASGALNLNGLKKLVEKFEAAISPLGIRFDEDVLNMSKDDIDRLFTVEEIAKRKSAFGPIQAALATFDNPTIRLSQLVSPLVYIGRIKEITVPSDINALIKEISENAGIYFKYGQAVRVRKMGSSKADSGIIKALQGKSAEMKEHFAGLCQKYQLEVNEKGAVAIKERFRGVQDKQRADALVALAACYEAIRFFDNRVTWFAEGKTEKETINVEQLIEDSFSGTLVREFRARAAIDIPKAPIEIQGDRITLLSALTNLIKFAGRATQEEKSIIEFGISRDGGNAVITLSYDKQLEPELLEQDPDYPGQPGRLKFFRQAGGIFENMEAWEAVRMHGGSIKVESKGGVTTFTISLPLVKTGVEALPVSIEKKRPINEAEFKWISEKAGLYDKLGLKKGANIVNVGIIKGLPYALAAASKGMNYTGFEIEKEGDISGLLNGYDLREFGGDAKLVRGEFSSGAKSASKGVLADNSQDCVLILTGALSDYSLHLQESDATEVLIEALRVVKNGGKIFAGSFPAAWASVEEAAAGKIIDKVLKMPEFNGKVRMVNKGVMNDGFEHEGTLFEVIKTETAKPVNAVFGDEQFEDAQINPVIAMGIYDETENKELGAEIKSIAEKTLLELEGVVIEDYPYAMEALSELGAIHERPEFNVLLYLMLKKVQFRFIPTRSGLFMSNGKFAAAHYGFGGEAQGHKGKYIYIAMKADGTPVFTPKEMAVIAMHELVHLVFKQYDLDQLNVHALASAIDEETSVRLLGHPDAVYAKYDALVLKLVESGQDREYSGFETSADAMNLGVGTAQKVILSGVAIPEFAFMEKKLSDTNLREIIQAFRNIHAKDINVNDLAGSELAGFVENLRTKGILLPTYLRRVVLDSLARENYTRKQILTYLESLNSRLSENNLLANFELLGFLSEVLTAYDNNKAIADTSYDWLKKTRLGDKWERLGAWRRSGAVAPLFSIFSKDSVGIGELPDLKMLVDWCKKTGMSILQVLPLNDTGGSFQPYQSESSFALDPMYLRLQQITGVDINRFSQKINGLKERMPAGQKRVDYRIKQQKLDVLREMFDSRDWSLDASFQKFRTECESCNLLKKYNGVGADLEKFRKEQASWLRDYAVFRVLKAQNGGKAWEEWPDAKLRDKDPEAMAAFVKANEKAVMFQEWLQWQLFIQATKVKEYAAMKDVIIQGDIPFLVGRDSADVWANKQFFLLDKEAGCPPNERWGNPPYNWDAIEKDGYSYIKAKLNYASNFYHADRIDHFVGILRVWTYNAGSPDEQGYFDPGEDEEYWKQQSPEQMRKSPWYEHGRKILEIMIKTDMMPMAEDLGAIPAESYALLKDMGIVGLDVTRWARKWNEQGQPYYADMDYRDNAIQTTATHDTSNLLPWYEDELGGVNKDNFERLCKENGIDLILAKNRLFVYGERDGWLKWKPEIKTGRDIENIFGGQSQPTAAIVNLFEASRGEFVKYHNRLGFFGGNPSPLLSREVGAQALIEANRSRSIFAVHPLVDWLANSPLMQRHDVRDYKINKPRVVSADLWSMVHPFSLESLLENPTNDKIMMMNKQTLRNGPRLIRQGNGIKLMGLAFASSFAFLTPAVLMDVLKVAVPAAVIAALAVLLYKWLGTDKSNPVSVAAKVLTGLILFGSAASAHGTATIFEASSWTSYLITAAWIVVGLAFLAGAWVSVSLFTDHKMRKGSRAADKLKEDMNNRFANNDYVMQHQAVIPKRSVQSFVPHNGDTSISVLPGIIARADTIKIVAQAVFNELKNRSFQARRIFGVGQVTPFNLTNFALGRSGEWYLVYSLNGHTPYYVGVKTDNVFYSYDGRIRSYNLAEDEIEYTYTSPILAKGADEKKKLELLINHAREIVNTGDNAYKIARIADKTLGLRNIPLTQQADIKGKALGVKFFACGFVPEQGGDTYLVYATPADMDTKYGEYYYFKNSNKEKFAIFSNAKKTIIDKSPVNWADEQILQQVVNRPILTDPEQIVNDTREAGEMKALFELNNLLGMNIVITGNTREQAAMELIGEMWRIILNAYMLRKTGAPVFENAKSFNSITRDNWMAAQELVTNIQNKEELQQNLRASLFGLKDSRGARLYPKMDDLINAIAPAYIAGYKKGLDQFVERIKEQDDTIKQLGDVLRESGNSKVMVSKMDNLINIWDPSRIDPSVELVKWVFDSSSDLHDYSRNLDLARQNDPAPLAILPQNLGKVAGWLGNGQSALWAATKIAAGHELVQPFVQPFKFINAHPDTRGATLVVEACYIGLALGEIIALAFMSFGSITFLSAIMTIIGIGAGAKVLTHVIIDWHYINNTDIKGKAEIIAKAKETFKAVRMDDKGNVLTEIYVDRLPANDAERKKLGLQSTGLNVTGLDGKPKPVWASTNEGVLALYADVRDMSEVINVVDRMIVGEGQMGGSKRFLSRLGLENIFGKLKMKFDVKRAGCKAGIKIDHGSTGKDVKYNEDGSMLVSAGMFMDSDGNMMDQGSITAMLGSLIEVRNSEGLQMAMNNFINLRGVRSLNDFKEKLEAFNRTGNGLMVVNLEVFKGLTGKQVERIMKASNKCGVKIYADMRQEEIKDGSIEELMEVGFSGYVREINNKMVVYDFMVSKDGMTAEEVSGYGSLEQFKEKMKGTMVSNRILNLDELEGLLRGGERSIVDRVTVEEILRTASLSLFKGEVNDEYARGVAYKITRDKLPSISLEISKQIDEIVKEFDKKNAGEILKAIGQEGVISPISVYYNKLAGDVAAGKLNEVRKEFLKAVIERMLAKEKLARHAKPEGLEETDLEELLGKAIYEQKAKRYEAMGLLIEPEKFVAENDVISEIFFARLRSKAMELERERGPQAINSMIELIAQLGEPKFIKRTEKQRAILNPKLIDEIRSAA